MTKITLAEFELNLDDKEKLISDLEKISYVHSWGTGIVFSSPFFRINSNQQPYFGVKTISLETKSKEQINHSELKKIIKNNLDSSVLIYRNSQTRELIDVYFLPEAINRNPIKRKLVWDTNPKIYEETK